MSVQVLVAAMNQTDHSLLSKMNIETDVIVGNQCGSDGSESFDFNGHVAVYLNSSKRGVSNNRNMTLEHSNAEYLLFADDDMVYFDGYEQAVTAEFEKMPDADVLIFGVEDEKGCCELVRKRSRVRWYNYMRYGMVRIAVRRESIEREGIRFDHKLSNGADLKFGEDTLFLTDCLKNGLKIWAVPTTIARLTNERESTWFNGYTEEYFNNKGLLFKEMSPKFWKLLCLQDAIRHSRLYGKNVWSIYHLEKE